MTIDYALLKKKPWNSDTSLKPLFKQIYQPKGMIGPEERRCYFWLGKNLPTGNGCIVDAGSFVGASTLCFAAGAAAAGQREFNGRKIIHSYDYFQVVDQYVGEAITRDFRPIKQGESYLDIFEKQTAAYNDLIEAHPGNFLSHRWHGDPVVLLFIDIAKTAELNAHAIGEFFPSLIPGHSVLVHQDYFHCWHPYIHISMQFLNDEFELLDEHVAHQSCVWRLTKPIPEEKIDRLRKYDLTKEERLQCLDQLLGTSSLFMRPMIQVVRIWQQCLDKDWDAAAHDMAEFRRNFNLEREKALWAKQAITVEQYIAKAMT